MLHKSWNMTAQRQKGKERQMTWNMKHFSLRATAAFSEVHKIQNLGSVLCLLKLSLECVQGAKNNPQVFCRVRITSQVLRPSQPKRPCWTTLLQSSWYSSRLQNTPVQLLSSTSKAAFCYQAFLVFPLLIVSFGECQKLVACQFLTLFQWFLRNVRAIHRFLQVTLTLSQVLV